ncbi:unnamed protein product [Acanthoscelides obtectus]|uniref:Uncharacterized protein n=1 Tax=Acanthoscelides obtectus TaxID=200917 RepID=A0A9P0PWC5_ACAOB|nr:unnamed protein product [Acanthoscelides obtectus]CAK1634012.1 hypothetical protein AOBTE_LOCUS8536 [Acanthoscelides obtectus]
MLESVHNFHYNVTLAKAWYGTSINGTEAGVANLIHEHRVDIGAGGILRHGDSERISFYDYLMPTFPFRTCFIFKNPGSVKPGVEVLRPFSTSTWYSTCAAAFVMCSAIKMAYWIEYRFLRARINYRSSLFPHRLGGRFIYFTLLILSTLLYNYYSSSLVSSLLNSKPWTPTNLKELYETKLRLGSEDQPYTTLFITQERNNTWVQQINSTRFYEKDQANFMEPKEGVALVKNGGFAYHSEVKTVYPLIAMTFDVDSICDLVEINFVTPGVIGLMAQKNSQYTKLFLIR